MFNNPTFRASTFTFLLLQDILLSDHTTNVTLGMETEVWGRITKVINMENPMCSPKTMVTMVKKKWHNLVLYARKDIELHRKHSTDSGKIPTPNWFWNWTMNFEITLYRWWTFKGIETRIQKDLGESIWKE